MEGSAFPLRRASPPGRYQAARAHADLAARTCPAPRGASHVSCARSPSDVHAMGDSSMSPNHPEPVRTDEPGTVPLAFGRYAIFHGGRECGEERWSLARGDEGYVVTGEQVLEAPHPFPSRHEYRVRLTREWRVT